MSGSVVTLAKKMERAMRNGTGFKVTPDEVLAMIDAGVIDTIHHAKIRELQNLCREKAVHTHSGSGGSTSAAMASHQTYGRPQPIARELAKSYIAQLSAGA